MIIDATGLTEEEVKEKLTRLGICESDIEVVLKHIRDMEEEPVLKNEA